MVKGRFLGMMGVRLGGFIFSLMLLIRRRVSLGVRGKIRWRFRLGFRCRRC